MADEKRVREVVFMSNGARCESGAELVLVRAAHACDYSVREGALDASGFEA